MWLSEVDIIHGRAAASKATRGVAAVGTSLDRRADLRRLALLDIDFTSDVTPLFHGRIDLEEQEGLLRLVSEEVNLHLSQRQIDVPVSIFSYCKFDTDTNHPRRLRLDQNLEDSGCLASVLIPGAIKKIISIELLTSGLLPFLELLDSVAGVGQVRVLRRTPGLLRATQVENALWIRVHVLSSELFQGN